MTIRNGLLRILIVALRTLCCSILCTFPASAEKLTILAASSTVDALEEVIGKFHTFFEQEVIVSYASSAVLARQIEYGAPADIFISANSLWMDYLSDLGLVDSMSRRNLATNSLVIIGPADPNPSSVAKTRQLSLKALIKNLELRERIAIGDPYSVPAGIYAREALSNLNLWRIVQDHLAVTSNVRSALMLVARGEVPLGIVYRSDALNIAEVMIIRTVPTTSHSAIMYPIAIIAGKTNESAYHLLDYLTSAETARVFRHHGFNAP